MTVPTYIFDMPWFQELSPAGKMLFFDACRAVHVQYPGFDIDYAKSYGIRFDLARSRSGTSPGRFRKLRRELLFAGVLVRVEKGNGQNSRDHFLFRIPR